LVRQAGAAWRRSLQAEVRFLDTGHFALETHYEEIVAAIREFFARKLDYYIFCR